jgi:hypothetical protein
MAHWAEIDQDNKVIRVTVGDYNDPNGDEGYQWLIDNLGGTWIKTSYNTYGGVHKLGGTPLHKNFAGIGMNWDGIGFFGDQPFPSWILNLETYFWEAPTPYPNDEKVYSWIEDDLNWQLVEETSVE